MSQNHCTLRFSLRAPVDAKALVEGLPPLMPPRPPISRIKKADWAGSAEITAPSGEAVVAPPLQAQKSA